MTSYEILSFYNIKLNLTASARPLHNKSASYKTGLSDDRIRQRSVSTLSALFITQIGRRTSA